MNADDYNHLLSERTFLRRELIETPAAARLTRMGMETRLRQAEDRLRKLTGEVASVGEPQRTIAAQTQKAQ